MEPTTSSSIERFVEYTNSPNKYYFQATDKGEIYGLTQGYKSHKSTLSSVFDTLRENLADDVVSYKTLDILKQAADKQLETAKKNLKSSNIFKSAWNTFKLTFTERSYSKLITAIEEKQKSILPNITENEKKSENFKWLSEVPMYKTTGVKIPETEKFTLEMKKKFISEQLKEVRSDLAKLRESDSDKLLSNDPIDEKRTKAEAILQRVCEKDEMILTKLNQS